MVQIRRQDLEYDDCAAVKITTEQHVEIGYGFSADFDRIRELKQTKHGPVPADIDGSASGGDTHGSAVSVVRPASNLGRSSSPDSSLSGPSVGDQLLLSGSSEDDELEAARADYPVEVTETPMEMIVRSDVFGMAHYDAAELIPLVDLRFEFANHLTAHTIPSPLEFYQERDAIIEILKYARARLPRVPTPLRNYDGLSVLTDDTPDGSDFTNSSVESMQVQSEQAPTAASPQSDLADWQGSTPVLPAAPPRPIPAITEPRRSSVTSRRDKPYRRASDKATSVLKRLPWSTRPAHLPYWP
ncbi:hypothetical protein VTO73DRAFT_2342 [Trametes versicolor]